jgi:sulfide:quinone oxidoreductase
MPGTAHQRPHRVVIAGGGVAALEALIALRDLAGDLVAITLVAPADQFSIRALSVRAPFAHPASPHLCVSQVCAQHDARFVRDEVASVDTLAGTLRTAAGDELAYDSLLVAIGARSRTAFEHVLTFGGLHDAEAMHGLLQDVEEGYTSSVAFVIPPGATWPLPIYELAVMTAERAAEMCVEVQLTIVTPQAAPLTVLGDEAGERAAEILAEHGIRLATSSPAAFVRDRRVVLADGTVAAEADRIVALPTLAGIRIPGLPCDEDGFLPVDDRQRVAGAEGVFAAGDGTTVPIKHGGVAARQADAAAHAIARRAGARTPDEPFRLEVSAKLLAQTGATFLSHRGAGADERSTASARPLWWPPTKVAARDLGPYLHALGWSANDPWPSATERTHS